MITGVSVLPVEVLVQIHVQRHVNGFAFPRDSRHGVVISICISSKLRLAGRERSKDTLETDVALWPFHAVGGLGSGVAGSRHCVVGGQARDTCSRRS